ncbi:MAG TPA: class I SAM-dependent methyltransferase [Melioribacteraceae bacterium]|nr:class I SAM-dependent methyltransferase [Melioribacteraceae bacterium]
MKDLKLKNSTNINKSISELIKNECSVLASEYDIPQGIIFRDYYRHFKTVYSVLKYYPEENIKILDVSAGFAIPSRVLQKMGYNISVTDSPEIAGHKICELHSKRFNYTPINNLETDELPFDENSYEVIMWLATIEHIQNSPRRILDWFYRILKPGGILIIDTPNILDLKKRLTFLCGSSFMPDIKYIFHQKYHSGHHREYTREDLEYVITQCKFKMVELSVEDTFTGLSIKEKKNKSKRDISKSYVHQLSQYSLRWNPKYISNWLKLPYRLLLKLNSNFKDTLFAIAVKK